MNIAAEFNLGNLLTILTMIVLSVMFLSRFRTDIQILVTRFETLERDMKEMKQSTQQFAKVVVDMATHATRQDAFDKRLDDTVKARVQMQVDNHARFEGLEERLRTVEAMAHVGGREPKAVRRKKS